MELGKNKMKKIIVILLYKILNHLICYRTNFGFYYQYRTEILDYLCIEPRTKVVVDSFGEPHVEIVWSKPPKWYKGWMEKIEYPIAMRIYNYLLKNKDIVKEYRSSK